LNRQKTVVVFVSILALLTAFAGGAAFAVETLRLSVDGVALESDVPPALTEGRVLVPARLVTESFGAGVHWDAGSRTVEITSPAQRFLDRYQEEEMYVRSATQVREGVQAGEMLILDVRDASQRGVSYISGSVHIPLPELNARMEELNTGKTIAVYCARNINAAYGVAMLNMQGIPAVLLDGGMEAWREAGGRITLCGT